jgi:rod shape determining protein RodA
MKRKNNNLAAEGIDYTVVWLYGILVSIGVLCIFMVEYKTNTNWLATFLGGKTNYSKQLIFVGVCALAATFILLTDSKIFTAFANLSYLLGILLMLATFVLGKNINGSKSWIPLAGGFNLQPAELCKIFTSLALAKFISRQEIDFTNIKSQIVAGLIALTPAALSILQHELGLALVYLSLLIAMYREGLPAQFLIIGSCFGLLALATLIVERDALTITLTILAALIIFLAYRQVRKKQRLVTIAAILSIWILCIGVQRYVVPYVFNNVLECYQSTRIYSMVGKDYDCSLNKKSNEKVTGKAVRKPDDYNVRQSKIAIGSGGFFGRGFLKGTQTRGKYVPEQDTDFIFTSLGEAFGFIGCAIFLGLYLYFLFRIERIAERQRSAFSRIYAYCVASILFFHILVNIGMTVGLMPVIGIPLPFVSSGGSSLMSFTLLLFVFLKLDAHRSYKV